MKSFHAAHLGKDCEVRIHSLVHIKNRVAPGAVVPIGWVAVGQPAQILPTSEHEKIWQLQQPLNFPLTVYGPERSEADMLKITRYMAQSPSEHATDQLID